MEVESLESLEIKFTGRTGSPFRSLTALVASVAFAALVGAGVWVGAGCSHWSGGSSPHRADTGYGSPMDDAPQWTGIHRKEILMKASNAGLARTPVQFCQEQVLGRGLVLEEYKLQNGLTIILLQDLTSPLFSYQTWYRVGSGDEAPGSTGMAHLFEHMLFRGTEEVPEGELDALLELNGAVVNAATWLDWTQYLITMPDGPVVMPAQVPPLFKDSPPLTRLELAIRLEADRMMNLSFTPQALEAEKEVVKNERKYRVEDDPEGLIFEYLYSNALQEHPYRWPTIGQMRDIAQITVDDCHNFYEKFYTPANGAIVVTGHFDREQILTLLNKYYGHLGMPPPGEKEPQGDGTAEGQGQVGGEDEGEAEGDSQTSSVLEGEGESESEGEGEEDSREEPAQDEAPIAPLAPVPPLTRPIITEPPQEQERLVSITLPAATERVLMGYKIPPLNHQDYPALEVISELLSGGDGSRLRRAMVIDEELVIDVVTEVNAFRQLGMFEILATVKEGQDPEEIAARIHREVEKLIGEPVSKGELNRAVNRLETAYWRELADMEERAEQLGHFHATTGDHWMVFNLAGHYRRVTTRDIQRVSGAWLVPSGRTTVIARTRREE